MAFVLANPYQEVRCGRCMRIVWLADLLYGFHGCDWEPQEGATRCETALGEAFWVMPVPFWYGPRALDFHAEMGD